MASRNLHACFIKLEREFEEADRLCRHGFALYAETLPRDLRLRSALKEKLFELAFLKVFIAWEGFMAESFLLYSLGHQTPGGFAPRRYIFPDGRDHAINLVIGDLSKIREKGADWSSADLIIARADRIFKNGKPFVQALRPKTFMLNDLKTIRNAIAHSSKEAMRKFESLVRRKSPYYPRGLTVGSFLKSYVPDIPKQTYFYEVFFLELIEISRLVVPK